MDSGAKQLQESLIIALKVEKEANEAAKNAQADYDMALAVFQSEHEDLVKDLAFFNDVKAKAKKQVASVKSKATEYLGNDFINDLPEGFVQKKTVEVMYNERAMRRAAFEHFHHLLVLDIKAVDKFIKDNAISKNGECLVIPDSIYDFILVYAYYKPLPNISNTQLLKLDTPPVIE